ncbi:hypothetical protein DSO57_1025973 [Entomophthora muscae]|uniref:Uncharacterized protein n=1 Tax=Entomophthora muscae TaxID=34485 RepID=A0ACC2TD44_9FUNG|nr:hypothetical protein DSO57_1025973 [Entomophthora muscae]
MVPSPKAANALYEQIEKHSANIRDNYISNFRYKFQAIPSYEFVAVVPNETEKNYPLFMCLTERLRQSLIEGSFTAVDEALRGMSPLVLKIPSPCAPLGDSLILREPSNLQTSVSCIRLLIRPSKNCSLPML